MAGKVTLGDELMFPSDYLCAAELKGKAATVTISGVKFEDLKMRGGASKRKPILTFERTPKKLVLNVTNADTIATLYGTQGLDWIGKKIVVYPTKTKMGRETVDCIRIREHKQQGQQAPPPPRQEQAATEVTGEENEYGEAGADYQQRLADREQSPAGTDPDTGEVTEPMQPDAAEQRRIQLDEAYGQDVEPEARKKALHAVGKTFAPTLTRSAFERALAMYSQAQGRGAVGPAPVDFMRIDDAIRVGAFDWASGKINHVQAALPT